MAIAPQSQEALCTLPSGASCERRAQTSSCDVLYRTGYAPRAGLLGFSRSKRVFQQVHSHRGAGIGCGWNTSRIVPLRVAHDHHGSCSHAISRVLHGGAVVGALVVRFSWGELAVYLAGELCEEDRGQTTKKCGKQRCGLQATAWGPE
jgi:hypothetical protein